MITSCIMRYIIEVCVCKRLDNYSNFAVEHFKEFNKSMVYFTLSQNCNTQPVFLYRISLRDILLSPNPTPSQFVPRLTEMFLFLTKILRHIIPCYISSTYRKPDLKKKGIFFQNCSYLI